MTKYRVMVREVVELQADVEAESKAEARDKARGADNWLDWDEVPRVVSGPWPTRGDPVETIE